MEVPFINIEYIFFKIYDFFGMVFGFGSGNNGFGPVGSTRTVGQWFMDTLHQLVSTVSGLVVIAFIVLFCFVIYIKLRVYEIDQERKKKYKEHFVKPVQKIAPKQNPRWVHVEKLFTSPNQNDWRVAIIEADTMLDELLQSYNFPGDNLGERLKNANTRILPTLQSAWEAHKVRNRIAHEGINFHISEREAQLTKKHFEFVFKDAGVI